MFDTVLIANRGEIAVRVARTCRELGLRVVVACSEEDRDSLAARLADRSVLVGPAPARRSYLNIPALIEAALWTGSGAVHPGYGFLSENPDFAEVCEAHGLCFVGPPPAVLARLGDKAVARQLAAEAGLPLLPGSLRPLGQTDAQRLAGEIGYPVIVKAAAGGGGRGMRVVGEPADFARAYGEAVRDARLLFGDGRVYVERYVENARHVEVQVLCDRHGNAVHLGERDCSVQRRYQKLIEESPAPGLSRATAARMGEAAVRGALAFGYEGVGTFEFLLDAEQNFYFIELNCRIQVEHPVTEMVTGVDLVREQLLCAAGEPLSLRQADLAPRGVAIECRVNAEDPARGFAPAPGVLAEFAPPGGPFVRVDTHCFPGWSVTPSYDSLLAKTIAWAPDRKAAICRMRRALAEFRVEGVPTTIGFLREVLDHPLFAGGRHSTALLDLMSQP